MKAFIKICNPSTCGKKLHLKIYCQKYISYGAMDFIESYIIFTRCKEDACNMAVRNGFIAKVNGCYMTIGHNQRLQLRRLQNHVQIVLVDRHGKFQDKLTVDLKVGGTEMGCLLCKQVIDNLIKFNTQVNGCYMTTFLDICNNWNIWLMIDLMMNVCTT